jgi:AAA+ superfamily predicted ATPase
MIVLHGPPGVGKTLAAKWAAATANILVLEFQSQRASLVGEAEQRTRTLHEKRVEPAFTPNLLITDELAHIPTSRDGNDGGVTRTQFGDWLSSLSDPRSRQSIILATTNVPEGLPAALQSRCEFYPVFSPSVDDLAAILAHRCAALGLTDGTEVCRAMALHLAGHGASPRDLDRMLRRLISTTPQPSWNDVSRAAQHLLVPDSQWQAAQYCDYHSLLTMSDRTCVPWHDRAAMPAHLAAVITDNGEINYDQVRTRLQELSHVRV